MAVRKIIGKKQKKMKLKKKALLYDIANIAYTVADTGEHNRHTLHRVRDICQDGNIDRVARVLGLAYANILTVLLPVLDRPKTDINRDSSASPHDYEICFRNDRTLKYLLTKERQLKIKESAHEYMVCMVLADWLGITLPEAADVWKYKAECALEAIADTVASVMNASFSAGFRRRVSPI